MAQREPSPAGEGGTGGALLGGWTRFPDTHALFLAQRPRAWLCNPDVPQPMPLGRIYPADYAPHIPQSAWAIRLCLARLADEDVEAVTSVVPFGEQRVLVMHFTHLDPVTR